MRATIEGNLTYISVRTLVWIVVSALQFAHVATHADAPTRQPRTLAYALAGVTSLFSIRDLWLLVTVSYEHGAIAYVTDFFTALATGPFFCVLLLISSGFCITIPKLADVKRYIFILPASCQIVDLAFLWLVRGISGYLTHERADGVDAAVPISEVYVLLVLALVETMMVIMIWIYIIDNSEVVARQLEASAPRNMAQSDGEHPVVPDAAPGYEDLHAGFEMPQMATSVVDEVDRLQKASLMRSFKCAVTLYLVLYIIATFMPAYGSERTEAAVIYAVQNGVMLLLMIALAFVFRVRADNNPYLLVGGDEDEAMQLDTRIEMTVHPMQQSPQAPLGQSTNAGGRAGGAAGGGGRIDDAFTLDETERLD